MAQSIIELTREQGEKQGKNKAKNCKTRTSQTESIFAVPESLKP